MVKLYSQQGVSLSNPAGIKEPEKAKNPLINVLDNTASITAKLSKQNYALGRAQLINDVLENAYNSAPDNPEQFNSLIKSGFEKGLEGLSEETKKDVYLAANDKVKTLQIKVGKNLNAKLDKENTDLILAKADSLMNGSTGILAMNNAIMGLIMGGASKDEVDRYININNNNKAQLKALAEAKNLKGNYIINSKDIRKAINEGDYNMFDVINEGLRGLDYKSLKEFDENTFQDRKRFKEKTGISDKTYDQLSKSIKNMRKDLFAADKREIKAQRNFNVLQYLTTNNPEYLEQVKDSVIQMKDGKKLYKRLESLMEGKGEVNPALITDEDANFINNFNLITEIINSKNDGSEDYDDKLINKLVDVREALDDYRYKYGASDETIDAINEILVNAASDQVYADAMSINPNSKLQETLDMFNQRMLKQYKEAKGTIPELSLKYRPIREKEINKPEIKSIISNMLNKKIDYLRVLRQPALTPEQKQLIQNEAKNIERRANIEIIKLANERFLPKSRWDKLEEDLVAGKPTPFEYGGGKYIFKGFTDKDIIFEDQN